MTVERLTDADLRQVVSAEERDYTLPPHSDHAEQAILGSMLKHPPSVRQIIDLIEYRDFYSMKHQAIWKAVVALEEEGTPIDYHLLADMLQRQGTYDAAGGLMYLSEIGLATPTAAFIVHYARVVIRTSMMRKIISLSQGLAEAAYRDAKTPDALMVEMERRLHLLSLRTPDDDGVSMDAAVDNYSADLTGLIESAKTHDWSRGELMAGWPTGLIDLDKTLLGLKSGDLIYLAARTSVGKSVVAQQIALEVARRGGPVYYASLEMNVSKLMHRAVTMTTGINRIELVRGNLTDDEYTVAQEALLKLRQLPIRWDSKSRTVDQIRRRAARWSEQIEQPLALIVCDYVQLLQDVVNQRSSRRENLSLASHNLKDTAEKLQCAVLAPAQVSREVLKRTSKMPDLSDLRESGDLEQDADVVLGFDRADYHDRDAADHTATVAILKARDSAADRGRGTMIGLAWRSDLEKYDNLAQDGNIVQFPRRTHPVLHDDLVAQRADAEHDVEAEDNQPSGNGQDDLPW